MMQTNLIDALERKTDHIVTITGNFADPDWINEAHSAVKILIRQKENFTTDDVWRLLEASSATTHEPRALGAILRKYAKSGHIDSIGYKKSLRPECHRRPIAVWRVMRPL